MSRTPCNAVADHQGATDPLLKTPALEDISCYSKIQQSSVPLYNDIPYALYDENLCNEVFRLNPLSRVWLSEQNNCRSLAAGLL